jgi:hypothetical protein
LDNLGNPIWPDLHSVDIETENGFIIAQDGTKKQTYHVDLMEPILPLRLSWLNTGDFHIKIKIDNVIVWVYSLLVVPSAQMRLIRSNQPSVDGWLQKMMIRIVDESWKTISGFNSFASLTLPDGAWSFDNNSIRIQDGISEEFAYISGTRSGVHMLQAQIPWIWVIDNIQFSVSPWTPLYINHREWPGEIVFSLRDRYGNQSTNTLTGMLKKNNLPESSIVFDQWIFKIQKKSGLYIVRSPELSKNNIQYTDNSWPHTISGISQYATYIQWNRESFDFLPDYNARYTVLAWGSFLRESEDILYNSTTWNSQSLAVSTLLEPSEQKNTLVSVFAGWGVSLGQSTTNSVQFSANLEQWYPVLTAIDTVTQSTLLRSLYRMQNANLMVCTSSDCSSSLAKNTIAISFNEDSPYRAIVENGVLRLYEGNTMYLDVRSDGKIHSSMNIKITPNIANSQKYLTFDVLIGSQSIGKMYYSMDPSLSVLSISDIFSGVPNTPIIDSTLWVQLESFSDQIFANNVQSYHVMGESTSDIDERKNGPSTIDSLGDLPDLPGVGWQGNNRTLLAYAWWDTVGESSRFFHTFTFINLGDPVAHVDKGATGTTIDGVDRTIGTQITSSNGEKVHSYLHKDMNADWYEDILVAYNDGYIELFQNLAWKFRSREKIAYIPDLLSRWFSLWDFQKDGYADIIWVNNSWSFILVDNTKRHFQTMSISSRSSVPTPTGVTQFKIYDMDNDGRDDIVYLTDSWNLGIMYATESSGIFDISLLDTTLWVNLVNSDQSIWWAIFANSVPQWIQKNSDTLTGSTDERMLTTEVFYPYSYIDDAEIISGQSSIDTLWTLSGLSQSTKIDTYVRSEYASAYGLEIGRSFKNLTNSIVHSGDRIRVDIAIKNTTSQDISNISYLEKIPTIFSANSNSRYSVMLDDTKIDRTFETITDSEYDARFIGRDIPAGKTIHIIYEVTALPASYGELLVWKFEWWEMGDDAYGDVGFKNSTTCGADMLIWRSQSTPHQYVRWTRTFTAPVLPDELKKLTQDSDGDWIPDRADVEYQDTNNDWQIDGVKKWISDPELKKVYQSAINNWQTSSASSLVHISKDKNGLSLDVGFDSSTMQDIDSMMDNLVSWLNCGFGGGGCMNFPMNWAPLAPGSAPVVFGYPVSTLTPSMGVPLFSFPTTLYTPLWPVPVLWPGSPFWAGWIFGYLPHPYQSLLRIYVTPTLTLGMWTAICFGPWYITGWLPPPWLSPLIPGWNCIVLTKSMPVCKADGSRADGDVSGFSGLWTMADTWNSQSCSLTANVTNTNQNTTLTRDIVAYLKDPRSHNLTHIYTAISQRGTRSKDIGTFMRIGGSESSSNTQVGITIDSAKPLTLGNIVNVHNKRIAAFPDFLMNWVTRQTEEITNALFNPPNLTIIPPTTLGQHATIDSSFSDFFQQFNEASIKQWYADFQKQTINAYSWTNILPSLNQKIQSKSSISASFAEQQKKLINSNSWILNSAQWWINAIRAGYTFIGKLPFVSIQEKMIPLNIPWILPQELDRYSRSLKAYEQEINETLDWWCRGKTPQACADLQTSIQSQSFINALRANMKRIEEYRHFPIKLQKYVTWKQRYMAQILCNIESIQKISSTWLKENGTRFRKWAELYVLLKAIADSWQPVVDILADTNASCWVCHNERYNAQYWKFKLLSAVIPSIPIIQFPRWPNIVLDLSDIRLGVSITVPNFQPRLSPIRLPELPNLSLPDAPNASLSLPSLPVLPPIPILPDLPDLPSFPTIHLPNLPSPPKVPKLMWSINGVLKIFKLVKKIYCYYQNTSLVPEWQAGDVIAQRTERQGTMSFDFLDVKYPQFSLPTVSDITVSSHVNFQLRSEFIAEFAQAAVKPLNQFTTDLTHTLPKKVGNDINIRTPVNDIKYQGFIQIDPLLSTLRTLIEARSVEEWKLVDSETFTSYFITQLETSGMHDLAMRTKQELKKVQIDQEKLTQNLILKNDAQFDILQKYINSQYSETAKIQNIIDTLMSPLSWDIVANFQYVSDSTQESSMYLDRYNSMIWTQNTEISPLQETNPLSMNITGNKLSKRMKQVADIVSPMVSDATSSPTSWYSPNFHGIYILTKRGEQTQLFDYSQNLTGDEKVEAIDIDKDGDMDYLYLLDGILYVKYTITQNPKKIIDTTINLIRIKDEYIPRSPNYFHENVISPELLSVTFMPSQSSERSWRMEFYNRYLEDDAIRLGINDSLNTPRQTVDIIARDTSLSQDLEVPVERSLLRVYDPDTMLFMSPKITFFTWAISFTLNVGRMIYTGEDSVLIEYGTGNGQFQEKKLQPHMWYRFPETYIIKKEKWNLYYIDEFGKQENYTYTDDLVWVPLLPWSQIKSSLWEIRIRDNIEKSIIVIPKNAIYALKNVWSPNDEYNFEINYPNGFYSARLYSITDSEAIRAWVTLLAPQISSDKSSPEIDLADTVKIPVYSMKQMPLKDIITESTHYTIMLDQDIDQDENHDGILDNDFMTFGTGFNISSSSLDFGPYNTLSKHHMKLRVTDEEWNFSEHDFTLEVYSPIPTIQSFTSSGMLQWGIDESIINEPINFFRVRHGSDIIKINSIPVLTESWWTFMSWSFNRWWGMVLNIWDTKIELSEDGLFHTIPNPYSLQVIGATSQSPMRIEVLDKERNPVYSTFFTVSTTTSIRDLAMLSWSITENTIWIQTFGRDLYIPATSTDPTLLGGGYIIDEDANSLVAIARDGNIYPLQSDITLKYKIKNDKMVIEIFRKNLSVGEITYNVSLFSSLK